MVRRMKYQTFTLNKPICKIFQNPASSSTANAQNVSG